MYSHRRRVLRFVTDRSGSIALKCFVKIGKGLLYICGFIAVVALFALLWSIIIDASIIEDDMRQLNLENKGFITKSADFTRKHKNLRECVVKDEAMRCSYTDKGVLKTEVVK